MPRLAIAAGLALVASACAANEATPAAGPSAGKVSLQTPPYSGESPATVPGASSLPTPGSRPPSASPTASFNPAQQRFVWVLPPGLHGKAPWSFSVTARQHGEVKHQSVIPLTAEMLPAGSRPEYPAGYEIVRLTDDGSWSQHSAELDRIINALVAEHGRGSGQLELQSRLELTIDDSQREAYCAGGKVADARLYLDEPGKDLQRLDTAQPELFRDALKKACGG